MGSLNREEVSSRMNAHPNCFQPRRTTGRTLRSGVNQISPCMTDSPGRTLFRFYNRSTTKPMARTQRDGVSAHLDNNCGHVRPATE